MKGLFPFGPRHVFGLVLFTMLCVLLCLLIGTLSAGDSVAAFTANPVRTREVWVMDTSRHLARRIEVYGHEQEVAVWSTETRWLVYYPRAS